MDPHTSLVSAKLSGRMPVRVGIGRMDYPGHFQLLGQAEFEATVYQLSEGFWVAKVEKATVPYEHSSPYTVTHVGMFMFDHWFLYATLKDQHMNPNDTATFTVEFPLPETL